MDEPLLFPSGAADAAHALGPFFQAVPTPYLVLSPGLIIRAANAAYLRIAGRAASDILGLPMFDAFPANPADPDAEGAAHLRASLQRVLAGACVDKLDVQRYDVASEAGGSVFLPRYWKTVNMPVLHADGTVQYIVHSVEEAGGALRDVASLRESEARFRTIADAMPQMVWSTLPDGYHDYFNEQWYRFTGVPRHSSDGAGWNDIFHPDDQARSRAVWQACLDTGDTYEIEYRLRHHSGAYRWVLGRALPVRAADGRIIRWMGTCTDIDAQKRAEDELRQAGQRKDEFLAMLAHELRNPLAPISSAAQLLILGKSDPQRVQKSGEIILRQVGHLTNLVDDLLDVSRVTSGLVQIEQVVIDLHAVLHSAVEQARPGIEARGHHLTVTLPPAHMFVQGDKTRLVQAIVNLLNNASKYTAPGGEIALSLDMPDGMACISVADNGIGIDAGLLPHVFDLFIQAERTPDRIQGGLGVGLALVKRIIELHQGSVEAISEGLGKGARFNVRLPVLQVACGGDSGGAAAQGGLPAGAGEHPHAAGARLPTVMIVDDNHDGAQSLAQLIGAQGGSVMVAGDGAAALRMAGEQPADVYILDIGLPGMDGYELARRLRATPGGHGATLVALTGYGKEEDRLLAISSGFDHHLVKPVDIAALKKVLLSRE